MPHRRRSNGVCSSSKESRRELDGIRSIIPSATPVVAPREPGGKRLISFRNRPVYIGALPDIVLHNQTRIEAIHSDISQQVSPCCNQLHNTYFRFATASVQCSMAAWSPDSGYAILSKYSNYNSKVHKSGDHMSVIAQLYSNMWNFRFIIAPLILMHGKSQHFIIYSGGIIFEVLQHKAATSWCQTEFQQSSSNSEYFNTIHIFQHNVSILYLQ